METWSPESSYQNSCKIGRNWARSKPTKCWEAIQGEASWRCTCNSSARKVEAGWSLELTGHPASVDGRGMILEFDNCTHAHKCSVLRHSNNLIFQPFPLWREYCCYIETVSLCRPDWSGTHRFLPASSTRVLRLKMCIMMPYFHLWNFSAIFLKVYCVTWERTEN